MTRHVGCAFAAVLLGLLGAREANAQQPRSEPPVSNEMRAEQLFQMGEKKFDSGRFTEACADFADSLRLGPKLGTLLNLALCHETIGRVATAWSEFHHGAAWAAQNGQKDRHDFAVQHALALEPRLPRVVFQFPAATAIASVDVDGEPLPDSRWYLPLFLDPGEHTVAVAAPGKKRGTVQFRVIGSPADQIVIVPSLEDDTKGAPLAAGPALPVTDADRGRRLVGWIAVGTGAAALGASAVFGLLAIDARGDIGTHCARQYCDAIGAPHYQDAQDRATLATITLVAGAALAAGGAVLVLTAPRSPVQATLAPTGLGATF